MAAAKLTFMNNGSMRIEGDFELLDPEGRPIDIAGRTRVSLCRCGQSANKPFCDGTHKTCGFASVIDATVVRLPAPAPAPPPPPKPGS